MNQYNNHVCYFAKTPGYRFTAIHNWWWKGTVTIANYADANGKTHYLGNTTCNVPAFQPNSQWTTCNGTPARGNETKIDKHAWGMRIWLRHIAAEEAWRSVKASGTLASLDQLPLPPGLSWIVKVALKDPSCIGEFVNAVHNRDVGYGVVMDINWWAPFWSCGTLKVWAQ